MVEPDNLVLEQLRALRGENTGAAQCRGSLLISRRPDICSEPVGRLLHPCCGEHGGNALGIKVEHQEGERLVASYVQSFEQ